MGRPKSPKKKVQVLLRIPEEARNELRLHFTSPSSGVNELASALWDARRQIERLFDGLDAKFTEYTGIALPPPGPGIDYAPLPLSLDSGLSANVSLFGLASTRIGQLARRNGVRGFAATRTRSNVFSAWGERLGRKLGLDRRRARTLGEFCEYWMHGIPPARRESRELLAKCIGAFTEGVGKEDGTKKRRVLFYPKRKQAYGEAWRRLILQLKEAT